MITYWIEDFRRKSTTTTHLWRVYITKVILTVYKMVPIISPPTSPTYV